PLAPRSSRVRLPRRGLRGAQSSGTVPHRDQSRRAEARARLRPTLPPIARPAPRELQGIPRTARLRSGRARATRERDNDEPHGVLPRAPSLRLLARARAAADRRGAARPAAAAHLVGG